MPEEKHRDPAAAHQLLLNDRRLLSLSGVSDVDSFDETAVAASTSLGELSIRGRALQITRLSLETGELTLEGQIDSLQYTESSARSGGFFSRLFR